MLAKHLGELLVGAIPTEYCAADSFSFVGEIKKVSTNNKFMVSFDVCSLFTNIPLNETIDIAVNLIFENKPNIKIEKQELKKLFQFTTSQTNFLYNGKMYDQIDGVAMGSPLAPILANLFMGVHEKKWIQNYSLQGPLYYR